MQWHPLPRLVVSLPAALWLFAFACDLIGLIDRENWIWPSIAFYALAAGTAAAIVALAFQFVSLRRVPKLAQQSARRQVTVNAIVLIAFALDIGVRLSDFFGITMPVAFSALGVALLVLAPRLGGDPPLARAMPGRGSLS